MYPQYQFEKNARKSRRIAMFYAIAFHLLFLTVLAYGSRETLADILPDVVKTALGMEVEDSSENTMAELPSP